MDLDFLAPWIPPAQPDLARLAMEWADAVGIDRLLAWPEHRGGGIGFQELPPFLAWRGQAGAQVHLVLVQAREVGAMVPGARIQPMPVGWLEALDLNALAGPLARHPDLGGAAAVHVVHLERAGIARVRSLDEPGGEVVRAVLGRLSGIVEWDLG